MSPVPSLVGRPSERRCDASPKIKVVQVMTSWCETTERLLVGIVKTEGVVYHTGRCRGVQCRIASASKRCCRCLDLAEVWGLLDTDAVVG